LSKFQIGVLRDNPVQIGVLRDNFVKVGVLRDNPVKVAVANQRSTPEIELRCCESAQYARNRTALLSKLSKLQLFVNSHNESLLY
jgi:hypothetical protein